MPNRRRAAREIALRVLYQVDVGKQPLDEVLDGALESIRIGVTNPIHQALLESRSELSTAVSRLEAAAGGARRDARHAARVIGLALDQTHEDLCRLVADAVSADRERHRDEVENDALCTTDRAIAAIARAGQGRGLDCGTGAVLVGIGRRAAERMCRLFSRRLPIAVETASFAVSLVRSVLDHLEPIDVRLRELASGWAQERQPAVDRNIMRLGAAEMLFLEGIPAGASINEAVELAKKFSTEESGGFVNGVLGALAAGAAAGKGGGI